MRGAPRRGIWSSLCVVLVAVFGCESSGGDDPDRSPQIESVTASTRALRRGVEWLLRQQAADGGWHSTTYGQMQGGVGNTALVLYAFARLPQEMRADCREAIDRATRFVAGDLDELGFVRGPAGSPDHPTYATALSLAALSRMSTHDGLEQQRRMRGYLLASQQTQRQGRTAADLDFGGWSYLRVDRDGVVPAGETNISVTSFALEALRAAHAEDDAWRDAGLVFLAHCQHLESEDAGDGGFGFAPAADDPRNKAGWIARDGNSLESRSYGTATADGLTALLACGVSKHDLRVRAAAAWLQRHAAVDRVPGIPEEHATSQFRDGLRYYYYAALARVVEHAPDVVPVGQWRAVASTLAQQQRADGSWRNDCPLMREDDPLIATALAVMALAVHCSAAR